MLKVIKKWQLIKVYRGYLNNLVEEYNNTYYHCSVYVRYPVLSEEMELRQKAPKFKVGDRVKITNYNNTFNKGYIKNWSR